MKGNVAYWFFFFKEQYLHSDQEMLHYNSMITQTMMYGLSVWVSTSAVLII